MRSVSERQVPAKPRCQRLPRCVQSVSESRVHRVFLADVPVTPPGRANSVQRWPSQRAALRVDQLQQ